MLLARVFGNLRGAQRFPGVFDIELADEVFLFLVLALVVGIALSLDYTLVTAFIGSWQMRSMRADFVVEEIPSRGHCVSGGGVNRGFNSMRHKA